MPHVQMGICMLTCIICHLLWQHPQTQRMHKNHTHLVRDNTTKLVEKGHIHEAELTLNANNAQEAAPLCAAVNGDSTLRTMLSLHIPGISLDQQVRLAA